jgi:hypothetical protein
MGKMGNGREPHFRRASRTCGGILEGLLVPTTKELSETLRNATITDTSTQNYASYLILPLER